MNTTHLQKELDEIISKMFKMTDLAIESIWKSMESLKKMDQSMAQNIIDSDKLIDKMEVELDEECIKIIVTKQPAAIDLRLVLSILKVNTDLERIGDLTTGIAKEVIRLNNVQFVNQTVDIAKMSEITVEMLKGCLKAFPQRDVLTARSVIQQDHEIDRLNIQIHRQLFSFIEEHPMTTTKTMSLITISKLLERIGDHATNIAERAIYYIEGEDIRHRI